MKHRLRTLLLLAACLLGVASCLRDRQGGGFEGNAVYYWRTELTLDSLERAFLQQHSVGRIYCRYFDVVMGDDGEPRPNATLRFADTLPGGVEVVPTVFITEDCMHAPHDSLARRIVRRLVQMSETHGVEHVNELQMDCDYTRRSRDTYYAFLTQVRHEAQAAGLRLSVTIRLHQLSMPVPPADYGVLMLYNTGDPQRFDERNPILDLRDVEPYLPHLPGYRLPLVAAYPVFRWQQNFHGVHIDHEADMQQVLSVKQAVEARRDELRRGIITYHLADDNINRYNPEDYEAIYHH